MAGSISKFLANIKEHGIAKTSHFDVFIPMPLILKTTNSKDGKFGDISELLSLRCESSELPGKTLLATENRIYGSGYKIPYGVQYAEITLTFIDTAELIVRQFFELWFENVYNTHTNTPNYPDLFVVPITVKQYDVTGTTEDGLNDVLSFVLTRAFPTNIAPLTSSWADDAVHKTAITLFYESFVIKEAKVPKFNKLPVPGGVQDKKILAEATVNVPLGVQDTLPETEVQVQVAPPTNTSDEGGEDGYDPAPGGAQNKLPQTEVQTRVPGGVQDTQFIVEEPIQVAGGVEVAKVPSYEEG